MVDRFDAILSSLIHCRGAACRNPYAALHPEQRVYNLTGVRKRVCLRHLWGMCLKPLGCMCRCGVAHGSPSSNTCAVSACTMLACLLPVRRRLLATGHVAAHSPTPRCGRHAVCTTRWTGLPLCPCHRSASVAHRCTIRPTPGCQPVVRRLVPHAVQVQVRQVPARVRPQIRADVDSTPRAAFVTECHHVVGPLVCDTLRLQCVLRPRHACGRG